MGNGWGRLLVEGFGDKALRTCGTFTPVTARSESVRDTLRPTSFTWRTLSVSRQGEIVLTLSLLTRL